MKPKWPTLEGRLKHFPKDELSALLQLKETMQLSPYAEHRLSILNNNKTNNMRKIFFRVYDLINERYNDQYYNAGEQFGHPSSCDWVAEQYVGFNDSSGTPIFEGDIVEVDINHEQYKMGQLFDDPLPQYTRGTIEFYHGGFHVCQTGIGGVLIGKYACCNEHGIALKIIGNIHDKQ